MQTTLEKETVKDESRLDKMIGFVADKIGKKVPEVSKVNIKKEIHLPKEAAFFEAKNENENNKKLKDQNENILKEAITSEPLNAPSEDYSDIEDDDFKVSSSYSSETNDAEGFFLSDLGGMHNMTDEEETDDFVFIGFKMKNEEYALNVLQVKEITNMPQIAKMPNTPDFIEGVIELRDNFLPVLDLRKRFQMGKAELNSESKIIIIDSGKKEIGLIVESVTEVVRADNQFVEKAPGMVSGIEKKYISGLLNQNGKTTVLLDLEKILSAQELAKLIELENAEKEKIEISQNKQEKNLTETQNQKPAPKGGLLIEA
ncbi:MAG: chemotaxis protein CheW [Spirochaetia bacterium]|nr:chemotaxis protein CheW [Spirochaetia bacterium]